MTCSSAQTAHSPPTTHWPISCWVCPTTEPVLASQRQTQFTNPNALRWSEYAAYAQDQWKVTPRLTITYGLRYEFYPPPYRDHSGVYRLDPTLPQSANVIVGGVNGHPQNAGLPMGWGTIFPRLGIAYRLNDRRVVRTGGRNHFRPGQPALPARRIPEDLAPTYSGTATGTVAVDPTTGTPLTLSNGIPAPVFPDSQLALHPFPSADRPLQRRRITIAATSRAGISFSREISARMVGDLGYVGTHAVRQLSGNHTECGSAAQRYHALHGQRAIQSRITLFHEARWDRTPAISQRMRSSTLRIAPAAAARSATTPAASR